MPTSSVSVIIPVYGNIATLPRALASIAAQTVRPSEILICDDGTPTPDVWPYLQSLGNNYEGIPLRVFQQPNAGAGAARNRCLAHASGQFVAFLDADDWWLPAKLERSIAVLNQTDATFVAHNFFNVHVGGDQTLANCAAISKRRDWFNKGNARTHYFYRGFIGILTVVIDRQALLKAGGFDADNRYALDWECWHAVLAANPKATFVVFPEALACYTLNPNGLTSKGIARLEQRESYLPRYVKGVAHDGEIWWPFLLIRGWATIQVETARTVIARRQLGNFIHLGLRWPLALVKLLHQSTQPYTRPNFLARIKHQKPVAK